MHASAAGAQVRAAPAWATVPVFAGALMKSVPSLFIKYRKYGHLSSEAAVIFLAEERVEQARKRATDHV
jgi:hypothetical protein